MEVMVGIHCFWVCGRKGPVFVGESAVLVVGTNCK